MRAIKTQHSYSTTTLSPTSPYKYFTASRQHNATPFLLGYTRLAGFRIRLMGASPSQTQEGETRKTRKNPGEGKTTSSPNETQNHNPAPSTNSNRGRSKPWRHPPTL